MPALPPRLPRLLRDTAVIFADQAAATIRTRVSIVIGLIQPVLYLVFFGPLLTRVVGDGGPAAWRTYLPGLLVQLALFASGFAGFGLIPDMRCGYLQRVRATPVSRTALVLGRGLRDVAVLLVQGTVVVLAAVVAGLRAPLAGVVAGFGVLALLGLGLGCLSYALALTLPNEYTFAPAVNTLVLPVMLLGGILLPMSFAPGWLRAVSAADPARYAVDGMRALYAGHYATGTVASGLAVTGALAVVALLVGRRALVRYQG